MIAAKPVEDPVDVGGIGHGAVEVGREPVDPFFDREIPDLNGAGVVPYRIVAPQLDLEALQAVALDPVRQQDRVAVLGLLPGQLPGVHWIQSAHQVPGWNTRWRCGRQEVLRVTPGKRNLRPVRRLEKRRKIPAQELRPVGLVDAPAVQIPVGIMDRKVEQRTTHQGRQPWHGLPGPSFVEGCQQPGQLALDEVVPHLHRVSPVIKPAPGGCQPLAKTLHGAVAFLVGKAAGPHPCHAERRLSPTLGGPPLPALHRHLHSRAGHRGYCLASEFQRDPRFHREVEEGRSHAADIGRLSHRPGDLVTAAGRCKPGDKASSTSRAEPGHSWQTTGPAHL